MNKKGFTLVELLAVIVILGLVATVASISVFNVIESQKQELLKEQISNLKDSAMSYYVKSKRYLTVCSISATNEIDDLNYMLELPPSDLSCGIVVSVEKLVSDGFFENRNHVCNEDKDVLIYRASQTDTRVYVPDDVCGS